MGCGPTVRCGRPPNSKGLGCWEALDATPPIMVRLAARSRLPTGGVRAMSAEEIAIRADIPLARVIWISEQFSWDDITTGEVRRFCAICDFDPTNFAHRNRQYDYIRTCRKRNQNCPPRFLTKHPSWETEFLPLIRRLKSQTQTQHA